jgi:hypothetical protein
MVGNSWRSILNTAAPPPLPSLARPHVTHLPKRLAMNTCLYYRGQRARPGRKMTDLHLADLTSLEFRGSSDNAPAPLFLYCVPLPELRNGRSVANGQPNNYISVLHYLFSTSKKCIAPYAMITKAPENTARPITSFQKARLSKPNALRMEAPGTSISRPYL